MLRYFMQKMGALSIFLPQFNCRKRHKLSYISLILYVSYLPQRMYALFPVTYC